MAKLKIIVSGFIGLYPSGGVTWDYIQYPLGLKMLGHEVYYIEDTGQYSNYRLTERAWDDPFDTVEYLKSTMEAFGFADRWAYRDTFSGNCYGMPLSRVLEVCSKADLFINISDANIFRKEYEAIPMKVLIDSDPMFTQLQVEEVQKKDSRYLVERFRLHTYDRHFSFGENIGAEDCRIPTLGIHWLSTRQPVCLDFWKPENGTRIKANRFTTVMNWSTRSKLRFDNELWGQKDVEFRKFMEIPAHFPNASFNVVMAASADFKKEVETEAIRQSGWKVSSPSDTIGDYHSYQSFIAGSFAEFSVAKETYVKSCSGWFSCRSACYLAAGRPVITEETQWSRYIPAGSGLLAFNDMESAREAIDNMINNIDRHSKAATAIAAEYFDSNKVLEGLLKRCE